MVGHSTIFFQMPGDLLGGMLAAELTCTLNISGPLIMLLPLK